MVMEKEKEHKNFPSLVIEWLEKLDKKIECLDKKVIDLREFLLGDEFHKNGFIAKSESHEKRIQKLEKILPNKSSDVNSPVISAKCCCA